MFEYSALQVGQTVQSSSEKLTGRPQKSQGSPSSVSSILIVEVSGRGVAQVFNDGLGGQYWHGTPELYQVS